jgi:hypothetical protein
MSDMQAASPSGTGPQLLKLAPEDNVAVVTCTAEAGRELTIQGRTVTLAGRVPTGHKVAVEPIAAGSKVLKYGAAIGTATADIAPGDYVHTHNVRSDYLPTYTLDGSNPYLK